MSLRNLRTSVFLAALMLPLAAFAGPIAATMYKNPDCTCCEGHAQYLRENGFDVAVETIPDLQGFSRANGVPDALHGCHTMLIEGYVVEGHVPAEAIQKLLAERPDIKGISIPGMPTGVPGMEGPREGPIAIYEIAEGAGEPKVFMIVP